MRQVRGRSRVTTKPRRRPRRRKRSLINVRKLALASVLMCLLCVLVVTAFTSPYFSIKKRKVVGIETIPESNVLSKLNLPPETNIFLIDKKAITVRLTANPVIKEVRLYRILPDTLAVRVIERKPSLVLCTGGAFYHVDDTGVPFRIVKKLDPGISSISYKPTKPPVLGRQIDEPSFVSAMAALALARQKEIAQTAKITVDQSNDLCLNVRDGFMVKLGRPEQLSDKLDTVVDTLADMPSFRERGEYIDVTCPGRAAVKLRD